MKLSTHPIVEIGHQARKLIGTATFLVFFVATISLMWYQVFGDGVPVIVHYTVVVTGFIGLFGGVLTLLWMAVNRLE